MVPGILHFLIDAITTVNTTTKLVFAQSGITKYNYKALSRMAQW